MRTKKIKFRSQNIYFLLFVFFLFRSGIICAQLVGNNAYIKSSTIEVGINGLGGYEGAPTIASPPPAGMHKRDTLKIFGILANPQLNDWATYNGDYFTPGTPENGWGFEIGSVGAVSHGNNCDTINQQILGSITNWNHVDDCYSLDWEGDYTTGTNLHFKINYFMQENDLFYTNTISIKNNTSATIPELYYYRNIDPDNNYIIGLDFKTHNTIIAEPASNTYNLANVKATSVLPASQPMSYFGFAGIGSNFRVGYGGFKNRDASNMWNGIGTGFSQTVGSTVFLDQAIFITNKILNLAPGATETFKFVVILDSLSVTKAINSLQNAGTPPTCTQTPSSDIYPYNSFSPNGDNLNDVFVIDNISEFPKNHVYFYNQWGQLLWDKEKYDNTTNAWDGKDKNGNELSSGTYYCIIEIDGKIKKKTWVELTK